MQLELDRLVMVPLYKPYPRYGRVAEILGEDSVRVSDVHCADPRCSSEHQHADEIWRTDAIEAANAYQERASWEQGRKSSHNAVL